MESRKAGLKKSSEPMKSAVLRLAHPDSETSRKSEPDSVRLLPLVVTPNNHLPRPCVSSSPTVLLRGDFWRLHRHCFTLSSVHKLHYLLQGKAVDSLPKSR